MFTQTWAFSFTPSPHNRYAQLGVEGPEAAWPLATQSATTGSALAAGPGRRETIGDKPMDEQRRLPGWARHQPKQQRALELILAGHSVTDIAAQVGVRRETVWRWRNDPSFASEVSIRQAQRRQSIHDELDAGVIESVRMLRGLVADTDAPPGARVRAATALMDRAGLTPAYAVEVRHKEDHAQQQATEQAFKDPQDMARGILSALPQVVAVLPRDEVEAVLSDLPPMT